MVTIAVGVYSNLPRHDIPFTKQSKRNSTCHCLPCVLPNAIPGYASNMVKLFEAMLKTVDLPQVYAVDPETPSTGSFSLWDDKRRITALCALCDEAEDAITESRCMWLDTPFSVFAVQCKSFMRARLSFGVDNFASLQASTSTPSIWSASKLGYSLQNCRPLLCEDPTFGLVTLNHESTVGPLGTFESSRYC